MLFYVLFYLFSFFYLDVRNILLTFAASIKQNGAACKTLQKTK
jgi:hypothetical protein